MTALHIAGRRVPKPEIYQLSEDGELERRCPHCLEYWPLTEEFWYREPSGRSLLGFGAYCRACWLERYQPRPRTQRPCAFCGQPTRGTASRIYCSKACRCRAFRSRHPPEPARGTDAA